jgi:hypothetical protein
VTEWGVARIHRALLGDPHVAEQGFLDNNRLAGDDVNVLLIHRPDLAVGKGLNARA